MIEGESGILAICPKDERPNYCPKRQLHWPNGAKSLIFTADEPERLRGKQHMKLWADELAAWRYPEAWDQASSAYASATTRRRSSPRLRSQRSWSRNWRPTRHDHHQGQHLREQGESRRRFLSKMVEKYEGTRLGRQELNAEILEDNPGRSGNAQRSTSSGSKTPPR